MKKLQTLVLLQLLTQFLIAQKFSETPVCKNKDIEVVIVCIDTASTDKEGWLKLVIRNKTQHEVIVNDAGFDLSRENDRFAYQSRYKQGGKHDLFDIPYERRSMFEGVRIGPYKKMVSSEYLTRHESSWQKKRETGSDVCAYFRLKLTFHTNGVSETIESEYAKFCFYWKPDSQIASTKLAQRLKMAFADLHSRQEDIIGDLMGKPEVLSLISTEELENALMRRTSYAARNGNVLILDELSNRKAIPNKRLTEHYRNELKTPQIDLSRELIYYWDDDLLEDVLKSTLSIDHVCEILDIHAKFWSPYPNNRTKVYDYLSGKLAFIHELPTQENFARWSRSLKLMSISRDKKIINYLAPLLDNEQTFLVDDWSKYSFMGSIPKNPDTIEVRLCDVAFVCLLRVIGQTEYKAMVFEGKKFTRLYFNRNLIEMYAERQYFDGSHNYALSLSEKFIKLSPESKRKIKNEVAAQKNKFPSILTLIALIAIAQIGLYLLCDKTNKKYGKNVIFLLILIAHFFIFPSYYYPEPKPRGNCGLPLLGMTLAFWIIGGGVTIIVHTLYYILKKYRRMVETSSTA